MAARRVSLGYLVSSIVLAVGVAAATFQLKYAVRDRERELAATQDRIEQERWAIQGARATGTTASSASNCERFAGDRSRREGHAG